MLTIYEERDSFYAAHEIKSAFAILVLFFHADDISLRPTCLVEREKSVNDLFFFLCVINT